MKRDALQAILGFLLLIIGFLAYSYYNYYQRSKAIHALRKFQSERNLIEIFSFRHGHLNVFDNFLGNKDQFNIIMIDTASLIVAPEYKAITVVSWAEPDDISTVRFYRLQFNANDVYATPHDAFLTPLVYEIDTIKREEIKGYDFIIIGVVGQWLEENKIE